MITAPEANRLRRDLDRVDQVKLSLAPDRRGEEDGGIDYEEFVTQATRECRLVLAEGDRSRVVFWEREPIECDWFKRKTEWGFLSSLVRARQENRMLSPEDFGERIGPRHLTYWRSRLKQALRPEMNALIDAHSEGQYRLRLPAEAIRVVDLPNGVPLSFMYATQRQEMAEAIKNAGRTGTTQKAVGPKSKRRSSPRPSGASC